MLVYFGYFLRHLSFLDSCQLCQFVRLAGDGLRHVLHAPYVVFMRLAGGKLQFLRLLVHHNRSGIDIFSENRIQGSEQFDRLYVLLRQPGFVQVEVEFLVIVFPPGEFRVDQHLLDAAMGEQLGFQPFGPFVQFIVVITIHLDTERAGAFPYVVAEPLVLQAVNLPASPP